jgi:hypothetical protein
MKSAVVLFATLGLLSMALGTGQTAFHMAARSMAVAMR